jgi:hypothetical protein
LTMGTVLSFCEMSLFHKSRFLASFAAFKPCVAFWVTVALPMPFSTGSPALTLSGSTRMATMLASTYSSVWTVSQRTVEANSSLLLCRQMAHRRQRPASEPCQTRERERRRGFGLINGNAEASAQPLPESVPARWPLLPSDEPLGRRAHRSIFAGKRNRYPSEQC